MTKETGWRMGVAELRKRFAFVLDAIESGRTLTITRDGRPVARLSPVARVVPIDENSPDPVTDFGARRALGHATECPDCGAALDPDGSCFACRGGG